MPRTLKIALGIVVLLAAPFIFAFLYGGYLAVTGQDYGTEAPASESFSEVDSLAVLPSGPPPVALDLPEPLEGATVVQWLLDNGYLGLAGEQVRYNEKKFTRLRTEDAVALHDGLRKGEVGKYDGVRLLFFALCAHLPTARRDAFAEQAGAVFPRSFNGSVRRYRGDYVGLFYGYGDDPIYGYALRQYAAVLTDREMVQALTMFGALHDDGEHGWRIRVQDRLAAFDAPTLQALHDAIDDRFLGDRKYLRRALREMIAQKTVGADG